MLEAAWTIAIHHLLFDVLACCTCCGSRHAGRGDLWEIPGGALTVVVAWRLCDACLGQAEWEQTLAALLCRRYGLEARAWP